MSGTQQCRVIVLGVSGGKCGKKEPAHDRPRRHGCLFHHHDSLSVAEGERPVIDRELEGGMERSQVTGHRWLTLEITDKVMLSRWCGTCL